SLVSKFPEVEAATISAVILHDLRANELYKLDSRYRDKSEKQILSFNGTSLEVASGDPATKEYKTLNSIIVPLSVYFAILLAHAGNSVSAQLASTLGMHFFWYNAHLAKIASEYEWPAVLAYHMAYFNKRRREMADGIYDGWSSHNM
ncbi:hypothetical protein FIBSPDRAFT_708092, partial [Athelia psychrophila]